jgi:DNA-binding MarR family transcriptional regulator
MQLSQMSEKQRVVFRAIVAEGRATNVTSGAFIKKYRLWSASSVVSALKALLDKDFVTSENGAYMAYDQFFAFWLLRKQF